MTSAPRRWAAAAIAAPILPLERLPTNRAGSIASCVGPAVTTMRLPVRSWRDSTCAAASRISAGSASRPGPVQRHARKPSPGPTTRCPATSISLRRFTCVSGFAHMLVFIDGASSTGACVASTIDVSASSVIPAAIRAIVFAVAGAMITRSARSASAM